MCEMGVEVVSTRLETISIERFELLVSKRHKSGCVQGSDHPAWPCCLTRYRFYFLQPLTLFLRRTILCRKSTQAERSSACIRKTSAGNGEEGYGSGYRASNPPVQGDEEKGSFSGSPLRGGQEKGVLPGLFPDGKQGSENERRAAKT